MSTPRVTVIIVSYNTCALLRACLASLRLCTLPLAIHVVDNASSDDSAAMVTLTFPEVQLTRLRHNVGFAAANNLALAALEPGRSDYYLLLNPDTRVHPGGIEHLVAFLDSHPRVGVAGPQLRNPDGSLQPAAFHFPTLAMTMLDLFPPGEVLPGRLYGSWWHGRYPEEASGEAPFPIDHPLGACMLVRSTALADTGLFDEQFFMYSEEVDLCFRMRQRGWAIWQVPEARVMHVGGGATRQFHRRMFVELHRSRALFVAKHYSLTAQGWHRTITRAGMLRLQALAWRDYWRGRSDRAALRAQLLAYAEVMSL